MKRAWLISASFSALAAVCGAACSSDPAGGPGDPAGAGGSSGGGGVMEAVTSDITGTWVQTHVTEGGDVEVPVNPSEWSLAAFVLQPDGSFSAPIPAAIGADGTFTIPGVPKGVAYIERTFLKNSFTRYVVTSKRDLDLGGTSAKRPDKEDVSVSPTNITLNVGGLSPWQNRDGLEIFALGSWSIATTYVYWNGAPMPEVGATSINSMVIDAASMLSPGRIEGSKGDVMYLTQLVHYDMGDYTYEGLEKVFEPAPFDLKDGAPITLTGSFKDVPQKSLKVTWDRASFFNHASDGHPDVLVEEPHFDITAEPGGDRWTGQAPDLVELLSIDGPGALVADVTYGNPYPASWGVIARAHFIVRYIYSLPDDPTIRVMRGRFEAAFSVGEEAEIKISPIVTPPVDVRINGVPSTTHISGVGASPKIEWSPPKVGSPGRYEVEVYRVFPKTDGRPVAVFITDETSVVIPPQIMESGAYYMVNITAEAGPGISITAPFKSNHGGMAPAFTGTFSM